MLRRSLVSSAYPIETASQPICIGIRISRLRQSTLVGVVAVSGRERR